MAKRPQEPTEARHYSAQDARGGEIILRTRTERLIFIAGLAGIVVLVLIVYFAGFR